MIVSYRYLKEIASGLAPYWKISPPPLGEKYLPRHLGEKYEKGKRKGGKIQD
jgi:hypothetical protein